MIRAKVQICFVSAFRLGNLDNFRVIFRVTTSHEKFNAVVNEFNTHKMVYKYLSIIYIFSW